MTTTRVSVLISSVIVASVAVVMIEVPPYRIYAPEAVVQSVLADAIVPANTRPEIEWTDGTRKLWRSYPAEVRFYGIEDAVIQNRVLDSVRKHLSESNIPRIAVRFFPKGKTSSHPVEQLRFIVIQK